MKPRTIDQWVARGYINRYPDGYCTHEVFKRADERNHAMAVGGLKAAWNRSQRDTPSPNDTRVIHL